MTSKSAFHLISDITAQEGVPCILIGGFAVNHHRVTRQTVDIGFMMTREDFDKIVGHLEAAGYQKDLTQENFAQMGSAKLSLMDVDFMFVDADTLNKILEESQPVTIARQNFLVPSLNHLIALKLHSIKHNPKLRLLRDLPDIVNLIRVNEVDWSDGQFQALCLKYGTQDLYDKIREAME